MCSDGLYVYWCILRRHNEVTHVKIITLYSGLIGPLQSAWGTENGVISNKLRQCTLKFTVQLTSTGTHVQLAFAYTQFLCPDIELRPYDSWAYTEEVTKPCCSESAFLLFLIKFYMSKFSGNLRNPQEEFQGQWFLTRFTAPTADWPSVWAL